MGHAGWDLTETLDTSQALGQRENLGVLTEEVGGSLAALDAEAEHTTAHAIPVLLNGDLAVGVGVKTRIVHGDDMRGRFEGLCHDGGVLGRLARTQMQGLQTAVSEPAVKGRGNGTDGVLQESKALVQILGVECGNAHQHIRVTVDILGHGVHDQIGAVVQRVLNIRTHKGIVDDDQNAMAVGDLCDSLDIDQAEGWVGRGLDPDEFGLIGPDQVLQMQLDAGRERDLHAVCSRNLGEISVCTTVHIGDGDNVRPGGERLEDGRGGSGAGRKGEGVFGIFQCCNGLLEVIPKPALVPGIHYQQFWARN